MGKFKDLTGRRFGRLVAINAERDASGRRFVWTCQCDCGNTTTAYSSALLSGEKESCGCLSRDVLMERNTTHGYSKERLYRVWKGMKGRCNNPHHSSYHNYGGRGIRVCPEWNSDYTAFREWAIQNGYDPDAEYGKCTIDRIDVDADYSPENCRWATELEQANNTRFNRILNYGGKSMTASEWSKELGIDCAVIYARLNNLKWSVKKTLSTPVRRCKKRKSAICI